MNAGNAKGTDNLRIEVAVRTIRSPVGRGRSENQDNFLVVHPDGKAEFLVSERRQERRLQAWDQGAMRVAVLDGMGGHSQGREAAENTVLGLLEIPPADDVGTLSEAIEELHRRLHERMHSGMADPGCTLTLLEIPPSGPALLFHAGDSRLYAVDPDGASCLTIDHVPATKYAMHGLISQRDWQEQVFAVPGSLLSQAFVLGGTLGSPSPGAQDLDAGLCELSDANLPDFLKGLGDRRPVELATGRVYLLASDGLWHLHDPLRFIDRWPALLSRDGPLELALEDLFAALVDESARQTGLAGDNSTAIALRLVR